MPAASLPSRPLSRLLPSCRLLSPAGFYKAGGAATASQERVQQCIEAARARGKEVRALLRQALEQAGLEPDGAS